jgi:hypothetical protein
MLERILCHLAVLAAETARFPRVGIAAVTATARLRVIKEYVVVVVVAVVEAAVALDAGFVLLARLADPDDVVLAERVLTDLCTHAVPQAESDLSMLDLLSCCPTRLKHPYLTRRLGANFCEQRIWIRPEQRVLRVVHEQNLRQLLDPPLHLLSRQVLSQFRMSNTRAFADTANTREKRFPLTESKRERTRSSWLRPCASVMAEFCLLQPGTL